MWFDDLYSPYKQIILLLIGLFLIALYSNQVFKNPDYNNLALAFGIFVLAWLLTVVFRYVYLHYYPSTQVKGSIIPMPYGMKCYFGEDKCENGNFTIFSVFHLIGYTLIGYFVPNCYLEIIIISFACEFLEVGLRFESKFILDPLINFTGYVIGSQLSKLKN